MTEFDASVVAIAIIGRDLAFVVIADTVVREVQGVERFLRALANGCVDFGGRYGDARLAQIEAIELEGEVGKAFVAARTDVGNDVSYGVVDVDGDFALLREQYCELLLEIFIGALQPHRHEHCSSEL